VESYLKLGTPTAARASAAGEREGVPVGVYADLGSPYQGLSSPEAALLGLSTGVGQGSPLLTPSPGMGSYQSLSSAPSPLLPPSPLFPPSPLLPLPSVPPFPGSGLA